LYERRRSDRVLGEVQSQKRLSRTLLEHSWNFNMIVRPWLASGLLSSVLCLVHRCWIHGTGRQRTQLVACLPSQGLNATTGPDGFNYIKFRIQAHLMRKLLSNRTSWTGVDRVRTGYTLKFQNIERGEGSPCAIHFCFICESLRISLAYVSCY
jgi:hypothetical protein